MRRAIRKGHWLRDGKPYYWIWRFLLTRRSLYYCAGPHHVGGKLTRLIGSREPL